jgi:hypothetical protein
MPQLDTTICTLDCRSLVSGAETLPSTGAVRLEVSGHLLHARVGDLVDVVGRLEQPGPQRNPGGFDFRR